MISYRTPYGELINVKPEEAINYFRYGISHDIFSEPVISYAKIAIKAIEEQMKYSAENTMTAEEKLLDAGCENTKYFTNYSYDDALIGVSEDGRAIYDYYKMIDWLMDEEGWSEIEAIEWVEFNTLRALPYMGDDAPIIMYPLD